MNRQIVLVVLLGSFLLLSFNNGGMMLYSLDEAKNAECAREMMVSRNWIVPTFNGELRSDKPPLHYYFMIAAYQVFGTNAYAARFFSAVFGSLTVLITFLFARRYAGTRVAGLSVMVLVSSLHFAIQFRMAVPDPYLVFFLTAALMAFYVGYSERNPRWLYVFYAAVGLGVLVKGPVAVLIPLLVVVVYLLVQRSLSWRTLRQLRLLPGALIIAGSTVPWYAAVSLATDGKWTSEFLLMHNVGRYNAPMEGHGGSFLITFIYVFIGLLPFALFIGQALHLAWRQRAQNDFIRFVFITGVSVIAFFALSQTKLPNYTVPAYPFLAIIVGYFLVQLLRTRTAPPGWKWSFGIYLVLMATVPVGLYAGLKSDATVAHVADLAWGFLLLPIGGVIGVWLFARHRFSSALLVIMASFLLINGYFFAVAYPRIDRENPVHATLPVLNPEKPVVAYKRFNPAYVFYLKKPIPTFDDLGALQRYASRHSDFYLISRQEYLAELRFVDGLVLIEKRRDLFETPTTVVLAKPAGISPVSPIYLKKTSNNAYSER